MSKKNSVQKSSLLKQTNSKKPPQKSSGKKQTVSKQKQWFAVLFLFILIFIAFFPSLKCEFTNWDDGTYVTENPMIWKLDSKSIKEIFSIPVSLNYHPLTMFSLAIDYSIGKLNPYSYHLNNVLLHILNSILVFAFMQLFIKKYNQCVFEGRFQADPFNVALIVAVFFGIHPMHVESVTWIAERKDVLYVFFLFFIPDFLFALSG